MPGMHYRMAAQIWGLAVGIIIIFFETRQEMHTHHFLNDFYWCLAHHSNIIPGFTLQQFIKIVTTRFCYSLQHAFMLPAIALIECHHICRIACWKKKTLNRE